MRSTTAPGDERGGDDCELALEHHEDELGDVLIAQEGVPIQAGEAQELRVPPDPPALALAEGEAVAHEHPLTPTTPMATKLCIMVVRTFFLRTMPA